jgi:pimeloyl-ACP methyl ester carboxylesterase
MPKACVNGINIHYQCAGHGPNVVLIHGLATNLAFWYLAIFWALRKDFRVLVYDLRGHGASDMPPRGYTSADMAADLDALLDHLQIRRAHLVGHSFGGAVALHYAVLHPMRVASLTLADPSVIGLQAFQASHAWLYQKSWEKRLEALGLSVPQDESEIGLPLLEELVERRTQRVNSEQALLPFQAWNGNKQTAERWALLLRTTTMRKDVNTMDGLTPDRIRRVNQPTLIVFGQHSRLLVTRPAFQETLPHCRVIVVPGVGHFHPLRKPAIFVRHMREFLMDLEYK